MSTTRTGDDVKADVQVVGGEIKEVKTQILEKEKTGEDVAALKATLAEKLEKLKALKAEFQTVTGEPYPETGRSANKPKKEEHVEEKKHVTKAGTGDDKITFSASKLNDFSTWYENILIAADIVDKRYPVKGMPVMKPYGYFMHQKVMDFIEAEWDSQGIDKAQFPLVIPDDFLKKEKDHVKGFEKEVFWVTKGGLDELEVKLALRPTSETAMYYMFALWVQSFRDLPLKVHQSCAVYRYETKDTRPLIRIREIHWNEAHTCHATAEEALVNLEDAWKSYLALINDNLCFYGQRLRRPIWDQFAGAEHTDVMDTVMPDGRVLQVVGAHYLGQKFAKVFDIKFDNLANEAEYAYMTCYGISTRLLAAALSLHGDDNGLILPPMIAKYQVVIVPIVMKKGADEVTSKAKELQQKLKQAGIRAIVDDAEKKPGDKYYYWEMKGVPIRLEVGPRDVENQQSVIVVRNSKEKITVPDADLITTIKSQMDKLIVALKAAALEHYKSTIQNCNTLEEIVKVIKSERGGFARIPFFSMGMDGQDGEAVIKEACGAEIRGFVPTEDAPPAGTKCIITGKEAKFYAYVARSY